MSQLKRYNGTNWETVGGLVTGDTLPIGSEVDYDGTNVPAGWEQIRNDLVVDSIRTKNMFNNGADKKNAYPVVNIGQAVTYNSSSASYTYVNCCYLEAGKTYTFSWKKNTPASTNGRDSVIVDSNNIELENKIIWHNDYESITWTPSHSGYLILCIDKNSTEFQIEEGDTATIYSPYQELNGEENYSKDTYTSNGIIIRFEKIGRVVVCTFEGSNTSALTADANYSITIDAKYTPTENVRNCVIFNEPGVIGYVYIPVGTTLQYRVKSNLSANQYPRFSFTYIAKK